MAEIFKTALRTIERTIMDRVGRGVVYTSPDEGVIVGMGGRSDVGVSSFGVASLSSRPPRRGEELGWYLNGIRRRTRRNKVGSVVVASLSLGGSCTPNDLLGTAVLSSLDVFMLREEGWREEVVEPEAQAIHHVFELCHLPPVPPARTSLPFIGPFSIHWTLTLARQRSLMVIVLYTVRKPGDQTVV